MFEDIRYHDFHIIAPDSSPALKWSQDWAQFPGLPYLPGLTEMEMAIQPYGDHLHRFMQQHWHYSIYLSIVYIGVILAIKHVMKSRPAFNLRVPMAYWSASLALFSIIGVVRCLPEFCHILWFKGFSASFTDSSYYKDWRLNLWYLFFVLSKALELIDTVFIVLRKQHLITLHWVHHCLTLCYSWYVFGDVPGTARWMVNMNFLIHSLMYTYYACKAFRLSIPRAVNVTITSLQIVQMLYGLYVNVQALWYKITGQPCDCHISVALTGTSLYGLFFVLFMNFFIRSYLLKPQQTKSVIFTTLCAPRGLDTSTTTTTTTNGTPIAVTNGLRKRYDVYQNGDAVKVVDHQYNNGDAVKVDHQYINGYSPLKADHHQNGGQLITGADIKLKNHMNSTDSYIGFRSINNNNNNINNNVEIIKKFN
ncbi:unnamed protein product [Medioppia subpectinata]|uniref:Elongation of very long chain fatty acids protein n=1 Tax=Medioppia subpectinata TaxID=1979941 RepID=A0A7R9PX53_9ACAR|nr:unnamed protein product [Medioppia subpectinata]CAG2104036.1 unnamed protein product [Medioppia subpectinata]